MKKNLKHIIRETNIIKYLNGDLSENDIKDFDKYIKEEPENKITFDEVKKIWDHSENIEDFLSIEGEKDWLKVKKRMILKESQPIRNDSFKKTTIRFIRVAAVLLLFIGFGFLAKQFLFASPDTIIVSTKDFKNEIELPDGSSVFLNKYSELKYPEKFTGKTRQVILKGEGYFEVTHNARKSFKVNIDDKAYVEVLGTSFNLRTDRELEAIDVMVLSGRVAFFKPDNENNKTILEKGEEATLQNGNISKELSKDNNFLSWKTGILIFENENFDIVLNELSKFYNKKFIFKETGNRNIRFTSKFENQELESVIEEIKLVLNMDYSVDGDTIFFKNHPVIPK